MSNPIPEHRRWHPRHLRGFPNMTLRAQADHLRVEHGEQVDGLDADGMGRVHERLHTDPRRQKARTR